VTVAVCLMMVLSTGPLVKLLLAIVISAVVVQRAERWTYDLLFLSRVQILLEETLRNNLGQVVHTYVPLSPYNLVTAKGR